MFSTTRFKFDEEQKIGRSLNLIKLFYQNKDFDSAKSYANELLKSKPNSSEVYKVLSQIHETTGDNDLAMQYYKKSLELKTTIDSTSLENNRQIMPTKSSFGAILNRFSSLSVAAGASTAPVSNGNSKLTDIENIERLLDCKFTDMMTNFQSITQLNENVNKIVEELSYIKKGNDDFQKKLILFENKQDEMSNKLTSLTFPPNDNDEVKSQIKDLNVALNKLTMNNFKFAEEISDMKNAVVFIKENVCVNDYNEDYSEADYEYETNKIKKTKVDGAGKLDQLVKKIDKDSWKCSVCETPNSNSDHLCVCCTGPNPNSVTPLTNAIEVQETNNFGKFGDSISSSVFSFGVPSTLPKPPTTSEKIVSTVSCSRSSVNSNTSSQFNIDWTAPVNPNTTCTVSTNSGLFSSIATTASSSNISTHLPFSMPKTDARNNFHSNCYENGTENANDGDYFKLPNVKLPDKYDQVTGEENEITEYEVEKAKLYILKDDEYKDRGIGSLKILTDIKTAKRRVLMRRDCIFKVCLNTHLGGMTNFEIVNQKFLRFSCIDFSEDKPTCGVFLLKFGNTGLLPEFRDKVESLKDNKTEHAAATKSNPEVTLNDTSEVELIYVKEPSPEQLDTITRLKLPLNFYDYEKKPSCKGCIGCNVDEICSNDLIQTEEVKVDSIGETATLKGLFSNIATGLNVSPNKVDNIRSIEDGIDNDHMKDKSFVSEKSKLLPEHFEVKTGEEDEEVVFNERSKMYHYVNGEWKERGVGNMKILKRKDSNNFRFLMRRDKILNVICNHVILQSLQLKPFQNSSNTLTWFARDYSEEVTGTDEMFALKFKNENIMKHYENSVKDCIHKSIS